jgi:hypothetical protein
VSLSPEQIAAQIEEEGDEDMIFGLGHGYANPQYICYLGF